MKKDKLVTHLLESNANSCTLTIRNKSMVGMEEIKFYSWDFKYKASYIDTVYDGDLYLRACPDIRIAKATFERHEVAIMHLEED